jgi:hypothetical protein
MIHIKKEGEHIRQGISIYHPKDTHSIGGCLRIGNRLWRVRFSKLTKKWNFGYDKVNPNALKDWEEQHGFKHE